MLCLERGARPLIIVPFCCYSPTVMRKNTIEIIAILPVCVNVSANAVGSAPAGGKPKAGKEKILANDKKLSNFASEVIDNRTAERYSYF